MIDAKHMTRGRLARLFDRLRGHKPQTNPDVTVKLPPGLDCRRHIDRQKLERISFSRRHPDGLEAFDGGAQLPMFFKRQGWQVRVLVACEFSGVVRDAFLKYGHLALSCDLRPSETPGPHYQGDVADVLPLDWDMIIAHPPCTYLSNSGVRWLKTDPGRWQKMADGARFFRAILETPAPRVCVENPIIHKYAAEIIGRRQDQLIQPWQFGHKEMKATCFWLRGLPPLEPTDVVGPPPKDPQQRKAWARVHRAPPGPDREKDRSRTLPGIADAMAKQWGRE